MTAPMTLDAPTAPSPSTPPHVLSPDEFDKAQQPGANRVLSPDEFDQAQSLTASGLKTWRLPASAPPLAPRDVTRTQNDPKTKGTQIPGLAGAVMRQVVDPALENPFTTIGTAGAMTVPVVGPVLGTIMAGQMVYHIAQYGWQKAAEHTLSPEDRARAEADPERISGEAAAAQAAMLGLGAMIHVGVKAYHGLDVSPGMMDAHGLGADGGQLDITQHSNHTFAHEIAEGAANTRIPADVEHPDGFQPTRAVTPPTRQPRLVAGIENGPVFAPPNKVKALETEPVTADIEHRAALDESVRQYQDERVTQDQADLSAARSADAEKIAKADAMRPRRREKATQNYFESEQGAETLGAMAARHGLPETASPYPPASPLAQIWEQGHAAATESFPDGFSMGGALTDNRIPGADEVPKVARGTNTVSGLEPTHQPLPPEGVTPETIALANALKPSRFRAHTTDQLAEAALDAQAAIERAQTAQITRQTGKIYDAAAYADAENRVANVGDEGEMGSPTADKQLAAAKSRMQQIEREFALRGVKGDDLAEIMQAAKEQRTEREAMQQEGTLAAHTGADDPFGDEPAPASEPVAADAAPARGLDPVEGTGETKTRGLSAGVADKAVANKLTDTLGDLPEYQTVNMADQARQANELLTSDPALARRVALGEVPAPQNVLPEAVFTAVENQAIREGDVATIRDLANGKLTTEATTMGQRIRALAERDPESPVGAIQDLEQARAKAAKDPQAAAEKLVKQVRKSIQQAGLTPEKLASFLKSLEC